MLGESCSIQQELFLWVVESLDVIEVFGYRALVPLDGVVCDLLAQLHVGFKVLGLAFWLFELVPVEVVSHAFAEFGHDLAFFGEGLEGDGDVDFLLGPA